VPRTGATAVFLTGHHAIAVAIASSPHVPCTSAPTIVQPIEPKSTGHMVVVVWIGLVVVPAGVVVRHLAVTR